MRSAMKPEQFLFWLQGFLTQRGNVGLSHELVQRIIAELERTTNLAGAQTAMSAGPVFRTPAVIAQNPGAVAQAYEEAQKALGVDANSITADKVQTGVLSRTPESDRWGAIR